MSIEEFGLIGLAKNSRRTLYCSFCGKKDDEVGYLVAGPQVFICNECVELCREIGQQGIDQPRKALSLVANNPELD